MLTFDKEKIHVLTDWLDEINYRMICACILQHAQLPANCCFPDFTKVHSVIRQENPMYGFIFAFFRLGHSTESVYLQQFMPDKILRALIDTGLAVKNEDGTYKMNNWVILPLSNIYLLSGLPVRYPTANINSIFVCHFSDEQHAFLDMIPGQTRGNNALELYGTHGAFGLQCAKNGQKTAIYPLGERYQSILQCNISLNRLEDKVYLSDIANIKSEHTKYDFICSRFPSFSDALNENDPLYQNNDCIMKLYSDAFESLLPNLLSSTGVFLCILQSIGNQYNISFNDSTLKPWCSENNMELSVNVLHKEFLPFKLGIMMENTQRTWEKEFGWTTDTVKRKIETFTQSGNFTEEAPVYLYTELIRGHRNNSVKNNFILYPIYNPEKTDSLYLQSQMLNF